MAIQGDILPIAQAVKQKDNFNFFFKYYWTFCFLLEEVQSTRF
jgi:hypothetical protein